MESKWTDLCLHGMTRDSCIVCLTIFVFLSKPPLSAGVRMCQTGCLHELAPVLTCEWKRSSDSDERSHASIPIISVRRRETDQIFCLCCQTRKVKSMLGVCESELWRAFLLLPRRMSGRYAQLMTETTHRCARKVRVVHSSVLRESSTQVVLFPKNAAVTSGVESDQQRPTSQLPVVEGIPSIGMFIVWSTDRERERGEMASSKRSFESSIARIDMSFFICVRENSVSNTQQFWSSMESRMVTKKNILFN